MDKKRNFIGLDLEMNQPSNKIIQIGIAIIDRNTDYVLKGCYYVDPGEAIDSYITELTGITDDDIKNFSKPLQEIADDISKHINEHKAFVNPVVWGHGDMTLLMKLFEENDIHFPHFGHRWIDVKTIYQFIQFSKGKNPKGALKSALGSMKMKFKGDQHRADEDAYNTLKLFYEFLDKQEHLYDVINLAKEF